MISTHPNGKILREKKSKGNKKKFVPKPHIIIYMMHSNESLSNRMIEGMIWKLEWNDTKKIPKNKRTLIIGCRTLRQWCSFQWRNTYSFISCCSHISNCIYNRINPRHEIKYRKREWNTLQFGKKTLASPLLPAT